ncbi:FAD-dependent monooxygenase [Amycolatopsis sp.]|jgi:2-polyprenyl-6-methoxyphenol hydroxylase-like FAD-dependent oxidoreductase|uniref:FAD-dependent monooxygenase n=1 Tax=Amycolatopsis sp. TaxID=37632 RepID=UPI002E03B282|nr:FAD-dependent monooxygenase [Amycolatopsis sp.]
MDYEAMISGGGPVGLMLACELGLRGVSTLVVERLAEPDLTIKAGSITLPAAEALSRRGFAPALAEVRQRTFAQFLGGKPMPEPAELAALQQRMKKIGGHFAGLFKLDPTRLDPADPDLRINENAAITLVPQQELERILAGRAAELGIEVLRGVEVIGFEQDETGVVVELPDRQLQVGYLIGCDGGRSTVRKLAGIEFPGTDATITGHQALVKLDDPGKLPRGWNRTPVGMLVAGPMPERILTVEFDGPPVDRDAPITTEELQTSLRHVSGTDVTIEEVYSATRFTDNARQATTYRHGRVLLAGDAAHVHSPFGGQGLNLGLGDAVNLGWKLAATLRGWAPEGLLDTYTAERHPIGARVLEVTRAQVALMRPDPLTSALRDVVSELMDTGDGNEYFIKMIAGMEQRYRLEGSHSLVGKRTPDFELSDGSWVGEHFADGRAVLFDFGDSAELRGTVAGLGDRVAVVSLSGKETLTGMFVRPDGCVAWASDDGDSAGLAEAVTRWVGSPVSVGA